MKRLRILWVGGLDRSNRRFEDAVADAGHEIELHTGDVRGRGAEELERQVDRADVVVIVVEVNSHGGALRAKALARRRGRPAVIVRKSSLSGLRRVLDGLGGIAAAH